MNFGRKITAYLRAARLWFVMGIGVKRWLLLLILASAFMGMGFVYLLVAVRDAGWLSNGVFNILTLQFLPRLRWRILLPALIGGTALLTATLMLTSNLLAPFRDPEEDLAKAILRHQRRRRGPRVVAIGGGTGMPGLLRGLTAYTRNITAIVTVADDGGSSGRLRRELGLLPPGDFRNNIAALARDETLMTQLMQYRFGDGAGGTEKSQLSGHAFGNLVIAALTGITGSFDEALLAMDKVLAMRGRVMPSTLRDVTLMAEVTVDGQRQLVRGESAIPKAKGKVERVYLEPENVRAYPPVLRAIFEADLIIMGPGSLYTSVLPNLLVPDLAEALRLAKAKKVYVCNVATQPGETDGYDSADHVEAIIEHCHPDCVDYIIANNNLFLSADTGGGNTVFVPPVELDDVRLVSADLVDIERPWRHDSQKVAETVISILKIDS